MVGFDVSMGWWSSFWVLFFLFFDGAIVAAGFFLFRDFLCDFDDSAVVCAFAFFEGAFH
jgi:hypothetical protein